MISGRLGGTTLVGAVALLLALLMLPLGGPVLGQRAGHPENQRCARFAFQSAARERVLTGRGRAIAVLGDSYSVGLGLKHADASWPSRLPGRTRVFGFSGSGFSPASTPCPRASYGVRVERLVRQAPHARLVVVEGGLNDFDQPTASVRFGIRSVLRALRGRRVLVVGPADAPSRAYAVGRIDRLLAAECHRAGVAYLSMRAERFGYLPDRLHLTPASHREFGSIVATRVAALP